MVLLDEVEKAHPEVFNVLLQLLDDGRLTDGHGRTVDFSNAVLIMTSNLGSEFIDPGLPESAVESRVMEAVRSHFRPEFLNRIDDIVVFNRLTLADMRHIVELQLDSMQRRLEDKGLSLTLSEKALDHLAETGFDPMYGARPLKRLLQKEVADRIALGILDGEWNEGDRISGDVVDDGLAFHRS